MFHIKICGVRLPLDVKAVENCGGDAIGMNFYPPSVRSLDPTSPQTRVLSRLAETAGLVRVGVFANSSPAEVESIVSAVGLEAVQLHGDETVEIAREVAERTGLPIIRAIKLPTHPLTPEQIHAAAQPWIDAGCHLLLDADGGTAHGGSGQTLDWESLAAWSAKQADLVWVLAGGLTPENVGEAMLDSGAVRVDVASGVEEERGMKSEWLIRRFVVEAKAALEA